MDNSKMDTLLGELANKEKTKKIKKLNLSHNLDHGDGVYASLDKIEDKINEIIEVLNKR